MRANICLIKNFEVITATAERLTVSPGRSYRTWSREDKERIVGETFAPGANVSAIAPSQLFAWRRKALASGLVTPISSTASQAVKFARFDAMTSDIVEIVVGDVVVRAGSDVQAERLAAIVRAIRQP